MAVAMSRAVASLVEALLLTAFVLLVAWAPQLIVSRLIADEMEKTRGLMERS